MFVQHDRLYFLNKITLVLSFEKKRDVVMCKKHDLLQKLEAGKPQNQIAIMRLW